MQRAAAVLRHEQALQNLAILRNRTLNAELWYRLAGALRGVADTYLRYAVETAFLAEQAYEFEADKRIDVIRFDYDVSDLGEMLAADFLLRDLDTLEQDLIVGQRSRQQQVRYVMSMASELPDALQELRTTGNATFTLRLEQIERRFPGLFNARIEAVEVLPLAVMDSSRFSLELTHLGSGQLRLKREPGAIVEPASPAWLTGLGDEWAVRSRVLGPETAVYSGLSRQEMAQGAVGANQRGAFEGRPGASAWRIDMGLRENRVVPDTLADVVVTFTLAGYHDATLRDAVEHAPRRAAATTVWLSGQAVFPDAYYELQRSGMMEWEIRPETLALQGDVAEVVNLAVVAVPAQNRVEQGRLACAYYVEQDIAAAGQILVRREQPRFALATNGLTLSLTSSLPPGATISIDCGDGSGMIGMAQMPHTYARPGRYEVLIAIASAGRLTEYRAAVVVSRTIAVKPPCIAIPALAATVAGTDITVQASLDAPTEPLSVRWRLDGESGPGPFTVRPGRHVLDMIAVRPLVARVYSLQRYAPEVALPMEPLQLATNRTFDVATGDETTTALNAFGQHVFEPVPLVPFDRWTLELRADDTPHTISVPANDVVQRDLRELADIYLALELRPSRSAHHRIPDPD